jgi:hypothetical protein
MIPTSGTSQNGKNKKNKENHCYFVSLPVMILFNAKQALNSLHEMSINELRLDSISLSKAIGS